KDQRDYARTMGLLRKYIRLRKYRSPMRAQKNNCENENRNEKDDSDRFHRHGCRRQVVAQNCVGDKCFDPNDGVKEAQQCTHGGVGLARTSQCVEQNRGERNQQEQRETQAEDQRLLRRHPSVGTTRTIEMGDQSRGKLAPDLPGAKTDDRQSNPHECNQCLKIVPRSWLNGGHHSALPSRSFTVSPSSFSSPAISDHGRT